MFITFVFCLVLRMRRRWSEPLREK